jgi:hypothetical protein
MSAGFDANGFGHTDAGTGNRCSVVSIYEDLGSRDLLIQLCDSLSRQFKGDVDFQFDWCRFKYLADPGIALEAAQKAIEADLILLAPQSTDLPPHVQGWLEDCLPNRAAAAGALVLVQSSPKEAAQSLSLRAYLRSTARRAKLDYLRLSSPKAGLGAKALGAGFRFHQPELDEFPHDDGHNIHWGINE